MSYQKVLILGITKSIDAEYMLKNSNQVETGMEIVDRISDSEVEQGNLEDEEDSLLVMG